MFTNSQLEEYKQNGYLIVPNLIKKSKLNKVKEDALKIFEYQLQEKNLLTSNLSIEESIFKMFKLYPELVINCGKHIQYMISLQQLSLNKKLLKWIKFLGVEFPNTATRTVLFFHNKNLAKEEFFYKIPPHQDAASMGSSNDAIVIWVPLINVYKKIGTLEIVPNSHKDGLLTSKVEHSFGIVDKYKDEDFVSLEMEKGDVLFFNSYLVHRSGNNISNKIRWAANFRYENLANPDFIKSGYPHMYVYKSIIGEK